MTIEHVNALRGSAGGRGTVVAKHILVELAAAGLLKWSGGAAVRKDGSWGTVDAPGYVVTPAGRAALLFFELGREAVAP